MKEINLELGLPTVVEALKRLDAELQTAKTQKHKTVKLIHGYGSSGKGGKIRKECRLHLQSKNVKSVIFGENFSIFDENTRKAFQFEPNLRKDNDLDRYNNGVTLVVL